MFKVGQDVFESQFGWVKINSINLEPQDPNPVSVVFSDGQSCYYTLDGKLKESDPFPILFESPEAMIEYFKTNAPPKPKKKVKKTVEGWAREQLCGGYVIYNEPNNDEFEWFPATLTHETEE